LKQITSVRPRQARPKVSVVIPAFNAADTLEETLRSAANQTLKDIEIIVVNDGSTDQTEALALGYSQTDQRIRVISKTNGGVASARNLGIVQSNTDYVAFLDADDLWHPTKLQKQLSVLEQGGHDMALVYAAYRVLDKNGRVLGTATCFNFEGWVLFQHFHRNFIGNGSNFLIKRSALLEIGGFTTRLRERGAEGCEDLLLQLRLAGRYQFGSVPECLVGYRKYRGNMSSNTQQMRISLLTALEILVGEYKEIPGADVLAAYYNLNRAIGELRSYRWGRATAIWWSQLQCHPLYCTILVSEVAWRAAGRPVYRFLRAPRQSRHFDSYSPTENIRYHGFSAKDRYLKSLDLRYECDKEHRLL
jgi:glycosyltransferase involved in cell wall biosynthesis